VLAAVTTPVGVSGAVFLLPLQLSVLHVPSPRVTPTNLMFNVISGPGGLVRYRRRGQFDRALAIQLVSGSVPGVVLGAVIRVYVAADPDVFRLLAAGVLGPVGLFILRRPAPGWTRRGRSRPRGPLPGSGHHLIAPGREAGCPRVGNDRMLAPDD